MIPECLYLYGEPARKWFTPSGLEAYKDTRWDPNLKTTSSTNHDLSDCLDENFMGMGDVWRPAAVSVRPIAPTPRTPAVLNPTALSTTAEEVLAATANIGRTDASIKSFGDNIFGRDHDGDTVHTVLLKDNLPTESLLNPTVQIDLTGMEFDNNIRNNADDESMSMSTMAHTTEDTRRRLKESDKQRHLLTAENELQATEIEAKDRENEQLLQANSNIMAQLLHLQQRLDAAAVSTAPAAPRRSVNILEPDKGSNLARSETPHSSRPNRSPMHASATPLQGDGQIANTDVAGIGDNG
jgi:hypothetical protein